ncbi:hypothetical protein ACLBKT_06870 [Erythrobacter sp. W302b]|uniref:hypothetical protein n=1 Tax=Erythrobacter sp. W302b TaxID=3389874 RepID=UPI00396B0FBA
MASARYRSLLRAIFSTILASRLSPADLKVLARELRDGRLGDELAFMLDQVSPHFSDSRDDTDVLEDTKALENLVKSKRLSKRTLSNIIMSLGIEPSQGTVREMLNEFLLEASPAKVQKLIDTISASEAGDSFLRGISREKYD